MGKSRLNIAAIEDSLRNLQTEFEQINKTLHTQRDHLSDSIVENMIAGYAYVNDAIVDDIDLFTPDNSEHLLEMNHIVLCGLDPWLRVEYRSHIEATGRWFYERENSIHDVLRWYRRHQRDSVWKRAAGVYIQIVSRPQLYVEGNHRTGALIMSYILCREGNAPFVLSVGNAKAYFDPSTLAKDTQKNLVTELIKLPRIRKYFARFLQEQANGECFYKLN